MSEAKTKHTLDARRLLCPMPVIRTQEAMKNLHAGGVLEVICTDPGTLHDIPTWCRMYKHEVILAEERDGEFFFHIKVTAQDEGHARDSEQW